MVVRVISGPSYEPISLAQAREWLRADATQAPDATLRLIIKALREDVENLTLRAFIPRQLRLYLPCWPADADYAHKIVLPYAPLIGVDSFQYRDTDGVLQTLASDQYSVHTEYEPGFIIPAYQVTWPTIRLVPDALQITYRAGYAAGSPDDEQGSQENLPSNLKLWLETKLATVFENREQLIVGTSVVKIPRDFTDGLLDSLVLGDRIF